jgi:hypothetical protein
MCTFNSDATLDSLVFRPRSHRLRIQEYYFIRSYLLVFSWLFIWLLRYIMCVGIS